MSFILDALRKSEHERQRQSGPAIAELPLARPASRLPLALLVIGALLAVNLALVLYVLLSRDPPETLREPPVAPPTADVAAPAPSPLPAPVAVQPAPVAQELVPPQEVRPLAAEVAAQPTPIPQSRPPPAPDPTLLPAAPQPGPSPAVTYQSAGEFVPRLETLPPQATAGLPVLNLDLHIFAGDPAERAVFINGRRYRQGDTLPEGVEVVSITPEGAVLRHRGQRFLLPRQ